MDMVLRVVLKEMQDRARLDLRDLTDIHRRMSDAFVKSDYRNMNYYAFELDRIPDILCSGTILLGFDLNGNGIQNLYHTRTLETMTYSLLGDIYMHGYIVFCWYGQSVVNKTFVDSLHCLPRDVVPDTIARFVLQHSENYYAAPKWRDGFTAGQKSRLDSLLMRTASTGPFPLTDTNGVDFPLVDWKVVGNEKTNLTL